MNGCAQICALFAVCWLGACASAAEVGSDCEGPSCASEPPDGSIPVQSNLPGTRVPSGDIDQIDLLFVVDDAPTMAAHQQALASALPRFFQKLVSGDQDGTGMPEFHAARDLHVAVASSNLGVNAASDLPGCDGSGLDAVLQGRECSELGMRFASSGEPGADAAALATEAACRVLLAPGCRFQQPLEAVIRALAPAPDGHGLDLNGSFVRANSLLIVIVLSDGEDCSTPQTHVFSPGEQLPATDPVATQGLGVRCALNPGELQPLVRYEDGFVALHSDGPNGVMFFALAGVPPELVNGDVLAETALEDDASRNDFYRVILEAPAMQPTIDTHATGGFADDEITPVCNTEQGLVRPSRRIVEVARSFGVNGLVQSICESNLARPLDAILRSIARRLGPVGI